MRVRLTKALGRHAKGSEHEVSDATGRRLIRKGCAEKADGTRRTRSRDDLEPKPGRRVKRGERIGATGGGTGSAHANPPTMPSGLAEARNETGEDEPLTDQQ